MTPAFQGNYPHYQGPNRHQPGLSAPASHVTDIRLEVLASEFPLILTARRCILDVGCNNGAVATQLAFSFGAKSVVGVDIDPSLVDRARSHHSFRRSRVKENASGAGQSQIDYFPISAVLDHGHRKSAASLASTADPPGDEEPGRSPSGRSAGAVTFVCEDWPHSHNPATAGPFEVILAFSVVKWIHLQGLDAGLRNFFTKCAQCLAPEGYLVLEIQPWSSYTKAVGPRKSPHLQHHLNQLQLRPERFGELLTELGFAHVGTVDALARPICIFQTRSESRTAQEGEAGGE